MHNRPHFKTYILIAIMVIAGPIGNLLLAKGMKDIGAIRYWPPSELLPVFVRIFSSWTIWIGIASLIAFVVAFMLALSMADYSFVQPAAALSYFVIAVLGVMFSARRFRLCTGPASSSSAWAFRSYEARLPAPLRIPINARFRLIRVNHRSRHLSANSAWAAR